MSKTNAATLIFAATMSVLATAGSSRADLLVSSGPSIISPGYTLAGTPPNTIAGGEFALTSSGLGHGGRCMHPG